MDKQYLKQLFEMDNDLITKYHIVAGEGLDSCVDNTWNIIKDLNKIKKDYGYYSVDYNDILPAMVGFFIKPEMRNKETVARFWNDVETTMANMPFITSVYNKNEPAVRFLTKKGKILEKTNTQCTFYFLGKR
jgi:hypothetical protein